MSRSVSSVVKIVFGRRGLCELFQQLFTPNFYCPPPVVFVFYLKIILEVVPLYPWLVQLWAPLLRPYPKFPEKPTVDRLQPIVLLRVDYTEGSPSLTQKG